MNMLYGLLLFCGFGFEGEVSLCQSKLQSRIECYEELNGKLTEVEVKTKIDKDGVEFNFPSGYRIVIRQNEKILYRDILIKYKTLHDTHLKTKNGYPKLMGTVECKNINNRENCLAIDPRLRIWYAYITQRLFDERGLLVIDIPVQAINADPYESEHVFFIKSKSVEGFISALK
ncbi:MAG: hypothetical protein JEZ14_14190 [Marinilabiliaceae bacterium]|nr:hypothetical protein [Marinilabiliaceae bacterium]